MMKTEDRLGEFGTKGQVTIFIIVGILIVSVILIFFFVVQPDLLGQGGARLGFDGCVQDAVENSITELGPKGGFINPEFTYSFQGSEYAYLCYTNEYYKTCTIQVPFLKQHFEENIERSIRDAVNVCYSSAVSDLRARGLDVVSGDIQYGVVLEPGQVRIEVDAPTSVGGANFEKFNIRLNSELYNMLIIATSILQFESELGDSDLDSVRVFYPEFLVTKQKQDEGTTLYEMSSGEDIQFNFASRSLAWPAGFDAA